MSRLRAPTEFGFATAAYVPPERPRSVWRTILFAALLALIPIVDPGVSAVYVDRRDSPETYHFPDALKTALIQLVALAFVALLAWGLLVLLGFTFQITPRLGRPGG